jgi:formylglycine-generating enzyme required for sulfatase activity
MADALVQDLRELIARRRVLVIVGSGVSIGATKNSPAASWTGLLKLGAARCRELHPSLDDKWEQRLIGEITSGDLDDTLSAAEKIARKLQAPKGGEFNRWLRETVGALQLREAAVLEALRDLQLPLATTNYDDLLERVTKFPAVTWRDQAKVFRVLRGEEQAVLHLHGHWDEPESVVLGIRDYEQVRQNPHTQAVIRALGMTQSLLFVGCGEGMSDPNFQPFRSWLCEVNASNEARNYRLALDREVRPLQAQHQPGERILVQGYGAQHGKLPGFLRSLLSEPATPATAGRTAPHPPGTPRPPSSGDSPAILEYLRRVQKDTEKLKLIGLGQGVQIELPIAQAYIPLNVVVSRGLQADNHFHFDDQALRQREHVEENVQLCDIFKWAARFESRGVLLLGDPGAGKTTGARQFCWRVLQKDDGRPLVVPASAGSGTPRPPEGGTTNLGLPPGTIPVFLRLRHVTPHHLAHGLTSFITDSVAAAALPPELADPGPSLLARKGVLWVFDGLDEVVNENARVHVCGWLKQALDQRPDDFFLVTSRYSGYQGRVDLGPGFCQFHVKPLDEPQVAEFVDHWYRAVYQRLHGLGADIAERAGNTINSLMELLRQPEYRIGRLRELPANPLMLTILCVVHHQDRNLPRRRADLYARCVRVLVEHWRKEVRDLQEISGYDPEAAEAVLAAIAWWLQEKEGRTTLTVAELGVVATKALADLAPGAGLGRDGEAFIRRMRDESGILAMWSAGQCGFLHLTFQEYLAGLHAAREDRAEELVKHIGQSWWREVILVATAIGSQKFALKFFTALVAGDAVAKEGVFVDQCLDEARYAVLEPFLAALTAKGVKPERQLDLLRRLKTFDHPELLAACREFARSRHAELASLAGEILQRAGITVERPRIEVAGGPLEQWVDPRTGIAFIAIPAGEFDMGSNEFDGAKPIHRVRITKPFWLGKYQVTNQEYERFLRVRSRRLPALWGESSFNQPQQPVVGVSWTDAQAFCSWAGCRLPTEAEWEYACRAGSSWRFCFGDDDAVLCLYAWYNRNSRGRLWPVGQKRPNVWGPYDMHGNVWEWCQDYYSENYYQHSPKPDPAGPGKTGPVVLRGGSGSEFAASLQSGFRRDCPPDVRRSDIGFRCVWSGDWVSDSGLPQLQ